jgi:hypothetical protein
MQIRRTVPLTAFALLLGASGAGADPGCCHSPVPPATGSLPGVPADGTAPWPNAGARAVFRGNNDGTDGEIAISCSRSGACHVDMKVSGDQCGGSVGGDAVAHGNTMRMSHFNPAYGGSCVLLILRTASGVAVTERNCMPYHGMQCDFEGQFRKVEAPLRRLVNVPAAAVDWHGTLRQAVARGAAARTGPQPMSPGCKIDLQ